MVLNIEVILIKNIVNILKKIQFEWYKNTKLGPTYINI
jgi:hypothetical protein